MKSPRSALPSGGARRIASLVSLGLAALLVPACLPIGEKVMEALIREFPEELSSVSFRRDGSRWLIFGGGLADTPEDRETAARICERANTYTLWRFDEVLVFTRGSPDPGYRAGVLLATCS
jgi:hypothetical protein